MVEAAIAMVKPPELETSAMHRLATLAVLALASCGTDPEIPVPAELTIVACGEEESCMWEGSHVELYLGFEGCGSEASQCRIPMGLRRLGARPIISGPQTGGTR